jgi:hypothetical protein
MVCWCADVSDCGSGVPPMVVMLVLVILVVLNMVYEFKLKKKTVKTIFNHADILLEMLIVIKKR